MPRTPLPAAPPLLEDRLRTRSQDQQPMSEQIPSSKRGVQAASAVLNGSMSQAKAMEEFLVTADQLKYYQKKLVAQGIEDQRMARQSPTFTTPGSGYTDLESTASSTYVSAWNDYCSAYIMAGQLVEMVGKREAARLASMKFNVRISPTSAHRASQRIGEPPGKGGAPLIIPFEVEHKLESLCLALREVNMPIFRFMILNYVNVLVKGTEIEEKLKHKEVRRYWYYHWLGRCKRLQTANIKPLEISRAQWATPENVEKHYDMLAKILVDLKLAVRVPGFDPTVPYAEELKIIKPSRVLSMDETRLTNDTTEKNKSKANRSIVGKNNDSREVVVNKGGGDGTGIGGSSADGVDLPGMFIFSKDIIHVGDQNSDVAPEVRPVCRRMDPENPGQPMPCRFWANAKGGVTGDLGVRYIRGVVEPSLPDLSPENPAVLIMDGHGSHFTLELLTYCRQIGLHVLLRPPHTTHILQGEDVVHFCVFKPAYHQQKLLVLAKKVTTGKYRLSVKDLLACAREPWETAFNLENTLKAWQKIGVQPFNRRVYWDLVAAKEKREKIASEVSIDPELLTVAGMVGILFPKAAATEDSAAPRRARERDTLHSSDLWDLPGGATGDDCYAKVQEKTAKRKAAEEAAKNKKDARAAKRQQQAADANQLGSLVISALTHAGQLEQLKVGEIRAALAFKGVVAASNLLKAQLKQLLRDALQLPSEGPAPRFVLPALNVVAAAPAAPEPAHESDDSNDDTGESDEEEGEIVA